MSTNDISKRIQIRTISINGTIHTNISSSTNTNTHTELLNGSTSTSNTTSDRTTHAQTTIASAKANNTSIIINST
eukprot:4192813-Pyramimonas_sp.AAC.1